MKKRKIAAAFLAISMIIGQISPMAAIAGEQAAAVNDTYSLESYDESEKTAVEQLETDDETDTVTESSVLTETIETEVAIGLDEASELSEVESESETETTERPAPGTQVQYNDQIIFTVNDDGETCRVQCTDRYAIEGTVEIPSELDGFTVTEIADQGFYECNSVDEIILPDTLKTIGEEAFQYCRNLPIILIPDSVESIGDRAFEGCEMLTILFQSDEVPENQLHWKGSDAEIVTNVSEIGETEDGKFHYYITKDDLAGVYQYNGDEEDVIIPDKIEGVTVRRLNGGTFKENKALKKITIPDLVTFIGSNAFYGCSSLEEAILPKNLISIGYMAFYRCEKLNHVVLPETVESIDTYAFRECSSLTSIVVPNKITELSGGTFDGCTSLKDVTLPDNLVELDSYEFMDCTSLEEVKLPESLEKIGYYTFSGCTGLKSIIIPASVNTCWESFKDCSNLKLVQIESPAIAKDISTQNACGYISKYADTIVFPESIEEIGSHILSNYTEIFTFTKDEVNYKAYSNHTHVWQEQSNSGSTDCEQKISVDYICELCGLNKTELRKGHDFGEWVVTKEATCTETGEKTRTCTRCDYSETEVIPMRDHDFQNGICTVCGQKEKKTGKFDNLSWTICDGVLTISGEGEMQNFTYDTRMDSPWYDDRDQIDKICIEEGVTTIGDYAFYNFYHSLGKRLQVELPESLTSIGQGAFSNCNRLWEVLIPKNVSKIGEQAFSNCDRATVLYKGNVLPSDLDIEWSWPHSMEMITNVTDVGETEDGRFLYYLTGDGYAGVYKYLNYEENVVIPEEIENLPVKKIGTAAFMSKPLVANVTIPNTVVSIANNAFYECRYLIKVSLPEELVDIGEYAFYRCEKLSDISLPEKLENIGENAFCDCAAITSVVIPNGVTRLQTAVFDGCTSLRDVTLPDYLVKMDYYVFIRCSSLEEITLPDSLKYMGFHSFADTGLKSIKIPKNVQTCDDVFNGCSKLSLIEVDSPYIAQNIVEEGTSKVVLAEDLCENTSTLVFPKSIEEISSYILDNYKTVTEFTNDDVEYVAYSDHDHEWQEKTQLGYVECQQDGNIVYTCTECGLDKTEWVQAHDIGEWTVDKEASCTENGEKSRKCSRCDYREVEVIPALGHNYVEGICSNCGKAEGISGTCGANLVWTLDDDGFLMISGEGKMDNYTSIKSVPWYAYIGQIKKITIEKGVTSIGNFAFYGLTGIKEIVLPKGMEVIGNYAFKGCTSLDTAELPKNLWKIGESAFYGCTALKEMNMPDTITVMGAYAFKNCANMEFLHISKNLVGLNESAFYGCQSLTDIVIPEGIKRIDGYVFKKCSGVTNVELPSTLVKLGDSAFYGCTAMKNVIIPDGVTSIGGYTFKNCTALEEVTLPEKLTTIGEAALYGCTNLKKMVIPDTVTRVNSYAFKNCTSLKDVKLSDAMTKISESCFYGCTSLEKLVLPDSITGIDAYAFRKCSGIKDVKFSEELTKIGESAFYGCEGLTSITVPEKVTAIDGYAFKSCTGVTEITLPESLETMGESAFYGCSKISSIVIPENVATIGGYAFSSCSGLKEVSFAGAAPAIGGYAFSRVTADAYYPADNDTWTGDKLQNYGGKLNWIKH